MSGEYGVLFERTEILTDGENFGHTTLGSDGLILFQRSCGNPHARLDLEATLFCIESLEKSLFDRKEAGELAKERRSLGDLRRSS